MFQIKDYLAKVAILAIIAPLATVVMTTFAGIAAILLIGALMVTAPIAALFATRDGMNISIGSLKIMSINTDNVKFWR